MAVPYTFGTATAAIPLSQLDSNFNTAITIGNTAVQLGNTITALANVSLVNATVTSLASPITAAQGGTGLATLTSNNVVLGNGTGNVLLVAPGTSGNALVSNGTTWSSSAVSANVSTVTGVLPIANGGTGTSSTTYANLATNVTGTLPVANGGTGTTSLTANNVLLGNGTSAVQIVAPGTSGNVLTSNGSTWVSQAAGGSSALVLLSTVTANNSATVDIETTFSSTYTNYLIVANSIVPSYGGSYFYMQMKLGGSYISSATYYYQTETTNSTTANDTYLAQNSGASGQSQILIFDTTSVTSGYPANFQMTIFNAPSTSFRKQVSFEGNAQIANFQIRKGNGIGGNTSTSALTGVRFFPDSGTIASGTFRLYGIANS